MSRLCIFICILLHLTHVAIGRLCSEPATDVLFLVDESGSLKPWEFRMELNFAAKMVIDFHLGPQNYQAGIFTFSTDAQSHVRLGDITDNAVLASRINQIPYNGGFTFLGESLKTVIGGFASNAGGRNNVRKVLIIITDGNTIDIKETAESVKLLQQNNIEVYAIVYGSKTDPDLARSLVSKSSDLFTVSTISDLDSVLNKVKKTVCIDEIPVCGTSPMDMVFVLDESSSIKLYQFKLLRHFLSRFVRDSRIGPENAQVSVVAFADEVRNVFWLNDFKYKDSLVEQINQLQRLGGMTYTNQALKHVRMESFKREHGGRYGAKKIVVVLTDGLSMFPEKTFREAQGLREMGAYVFAVGVGQGVSMDELRKIASADDNVFYVTSFRVLIDIEHEFRSKICQIR